MGIIIRKFYRLTAKAIVPKLRYSQYIYEEVLNKYIDHDNTWLDLGCGHQILPEWRFREEQELVNKCKMIVGIDFDFDSLKQNKIIHNKLRGCIQQRSATHEPKTSLGVR